MTELARNIARGAAEATHDAVCACKGKHSGYTLRSRDLDAIGPAAATRVLRVLAASGAFSPADTTRLQLLADETSQIDTLYPDADWTSPASPAGGGEK